MHDAQFAAAARPARYSILRLPMRPYSIGHEILLLAQGNPILYSGFDSLPANEQRAAVIRAALICSQDWLDNQKPHRWLGLWSWLNRNTDYALAIADFKNYRDAGSTFPNVPDKEAGRIASNMLGEEPRKGRELGSPYLARVYNFICEKPETEIRAHGKTTFDFPLGLANFLYLTRLECDGDFKIENAKEMEIKNEMAGHREKIASEPEEAECQH